MLNIDARLHELGLRVQEGSVTDDELAEMSQLAKSKRQARHDRLALVAGVRRTIEDNSISADLLFELDALQAIVTRLSLLPSTPHASPRSQHRGTRQNKVTGSSWVRQKSGLALVEVKLEGAKGFPCRYCEGDALVKKAYVPAGLKLLDDGQLELNLQRHYTHAGQQYFATEAGQAELAKLIHFIKTRKVKPRR